MERGEHTDKIGFPRDFPKERQRRIDEAVPVSFRTRSRLYRALKESDPMRKIRTLELRSRFEEGSYSIDANEVARKIIEESDLMGRPEGGRRRADHQIDEGRS
jgi:anti-sigma28 factor (negative regulator of flagellin synthesis)